VHAVEKDDASGGSLQIEVCLPVKSGDRRVDRLAAVAAQQLSQGAVLQFAFVEIAENEKRKKVKI